MNVYLHIERLVLDGVAVAPGQQPRLQAALRTELARLLAEGGLAPGLLAGGAMPDVPAGVMQLTGENDPVNLGQQIAQALYRGIGP